MLLPPRFIIAFTALVVFTACQNSSGGHDHDADHPTEAALRQPQTAEDSLYRQVMDVHDEVMPKMGKIRGAQQKARQRLDSLALQGSPAGKQYRRQLEKLINDLNNADFAMDKWMIEFNIDSAKDNKPLRMQYLRSELEKVNKVKAAILGSLSGADTLINR